MANDIKINVDGMDLAVIAVILVLGFGGWCDSKDCIDCQPAEADSGPVSYTVPTPLPEYSPPPVYVFPSAEIGPVEDPYAALEDLRAQTQMQLTLETLESKAIDGEIQYEPN